MQSPQRLLLFLVTTLLLLGIFPSSALAGVTVSSRLKTTVKPISQTLESGRYAVGPSSVSSMSTSTDGTAVMSYYDTSNLDLKFIKCSDASCTATVITTLDSTGDVGNFNSIAKGSDGFPVISYYDATNGDLKFIKCNDALCSSSTIRTLDSTGDVGLFTAIAVPPDTFPVIAYYDVTNAQLKYLRCSNTSCSSSTINVIDNGNRVGQGIAIAVGADTFSAVAYYDANNTFLLFVKCGNNTCSSKSKRTLDNTAGAGYSPSMVIGSDTFPIISYYNTNLQQLKFLKCGNTSCTSSTIRTTKSSQIFLYGGTQIMTGSDTFPAISYSTGGYSGEVALAFVKCSDTSCSASTTSILDGNTSVGWYPTIIKGSDGFPMVSYHDGANNTRKFTKCANVSCTSTSTTALDTNEIVSISHSIAKGGDGTPIVSYYEGTNQDLKFAKCSNTTCSATSTLILDYVGDVGRYNSIAKGGDSYPIISYYDATNGDLKFLKCSNLFCASSTIRTLDAGGDVGKYTSIAVGVDTFPIISYYDVTNGDLKFTKCGNVSCSATTTRTLDSSGNVGQYTATTLGGDTFPAITYYDVTNGDLKFAHCTDSSCSSPSLATLDAGGDVGSYSSIAKGSDGYPVISYFDTTNTQLKFIKCTDSSCSSPTIRTLTGSGTSTSIAVGSDGLPVISYYDTTRTSLATLKCADASCSSSTITNITGGIVPASIAIGKDGYPIVAYPSSSGRGLRFTYQGNISTVVKKESGLGRLAQRSVVAPSTLSTPITLVQGINGFPTTVYRKNNTIQLLQCTDAVCSATTTSTIVPANTVHSIAIGPDGFLNLLYSTSTSNVLKCNNSSCTATSSSLLPSFTADYGSIAIRGDGSPVIAYTNSIGFLFAKCNDVLCSSFSTSTVSAGEFNFALSVVVPSDGLPIITYYRNVFGSYGIYFIKCNDSACVTFGSNALDLGISALSTYTAVGSDGFPIISYSPLFPTDTLKFIKCADAACASFTTQTFNIVGSGVTAMALSSSGFPIIAASSNNGIELVICKNLSCSSFSRGNFASSRSATSISVALVSGVPVVSYVDGSGVMRLLRCNNSACSALSILGKSNPTTASSGLLGYWSLNGKDSTDKFYDTSGNANNGYATNTATSTILAPGRIGQGIAIPSTGGISMGDVSSMNSLTTLSTSAWVKTTSTGSVSHILDKSSCSQTTGDGPFELGMNITAPNTDVAEFAIYKNGGSPSLYSVRSTQTGLINNGKWHHLTGTYDGSLLSLYIDGALSSTTSVPAITLTNTSNPFTLGGVCSGATLFPWNGSIDEVRVSNRALTANEVKVLYLRGR